MRNSYLVILSCLVSIPIIYVILFIHTFFNLHNEFQDNFKGFQAIQVHRLAHQLWKAGRRDLALFIQSRNSEAFSVDIHPAATIGQGVMFDHATGVVVGETAVIENNVVNKVRFTCVLGRANRGGGCSDLAI